MATRPVFVVKTTYPYYSVVSIDFHYAAGFALVQRQKNIAAIHAQYEKEYPKSRILEASSKAPTELGKSLSPFYLKTEYMGKEYPVECVFQAIKVFQKGGPYLNLLDEQPVKAKTTSLTKTSGALLYYEYNGTRYPLDPKGWMYEWIYMHALHKQPELVEKLAGYNAFTDIAFNPKTGSTCQAKALAIYLGLLKKGLLDFALESVGNFLKTLYHIKYEE